MAEPQKDVLRVSDVFVFLGWEGWENIYRGMLHIQFVLRHVRYMLPT
jgi:hypothetical protein